MQEKIQIISDGSLDLSRELTRERDILVVPFYVSFDGETYLKEGGTGYPRVLSENGGSSGCISEDVDAVGG